MKFIEESVIETKIERYNEPNHLNEDAWVLKDENPVLFDFISTERLDLLTPEELYLLEFITIVVYSSVRTSLGKPPRITGKELEIHEEKNWETWNENISKSPSKAFDAFFVSYPQEDLLAFVEDALHYDEDSPLTAVGLELIAVTAKSIIDTMDVLN